MKIGIVPIGFIRVKKEVRHKRPNVISSFTLIWFYGVGKRLF